MLSRKVKTTADLQSALREGFPYATFERLLTALDLTSKGLAELLGVAPRTLARRKKGQQLSPTESDRLYRVAYITALAVDVLGSMEKAKRWLSAENRALGGSAPIGVLDTEIGERQVEELLQRIHYGVFS